MRQILSLLHKNYKENGKIVLQTFAMIITKTIFDI